MSINQDSEHNLANLLYSSGTDERVPEEAETHGLMEYLQHGYHETDTGDVGTQARTDHSSSLAPLPGHQLATDRPTSGTSSPQPGSNPDRASQQPTFNAYHPGEIHRALSSGTSGAPTAGGVTGGGVGIGISGRSNSPPNSSIPIPNSLARLASETISSLSLPDPNILNGQDVIEQAALLANTSDRGEMGGKRRKLPHERAGWKEMDEQNGNGSGSKRKRVKKNDYSNQIDEIPSSITEIDHQQNDNLVNTEIPITSETNQGVNSVTQEKYENDMRQLTELSHSIMNKEINPTLTGLAIARELSQSKENQSSSDTSLDPSLSVPSPSAAGQNQLSQTAQAVINEANDSKLSRAEQNKRAQQAFRRRREEHMKKLELDSAQLVLVRRQMDQKDALLRDLVLALESSKIEIAALRSSLQFIIPHSSIFPLTSQGTLNLGEEVTILNDSQTGAVSEEEVLNAFDLLEKQAREVAKQNRNRRE